MPDTSDMLIFWSVVMLRFFIPLFIPIYPLPAVIACLILDMVDQTICSLACPLKATRAMIRLLTIITWL